MIFVTGFARGGTSWLRTCVAAHPDITMIPHEMPIFREHHADHHAIDRLVTEAIESKGLSGTRFVNKAPANAPWVGKTAATVPEAKFLFIIRDPRDVFISHKRGNQEWMRGANSTVHGCMDKIERYYEGYREGSQLPNLMLVRYEDLHQDFHETMRRVYEFVGVSTDRKFLNAAADKCNFWRMASSRHQENRDSPNRKGVVGDWINFLEPHERRWYQRSTYWSNFMRDYGYDWSEVTYESILRAMCEAGIESLDEDDVLELHLHEGRPNLLLLHDIDLLKTEESRSQVLALAQIEGDLGLASIFNFLPLDDMRYEPLREDQIVDFIKEVQRRAPRGSIGIHLNAAERFFPHDMPDTSTDDPLIAEKMTQAIAYLHKQLDDYERHGITFRFGTAHGYGRGAKEPNNASEVFRHELGKRGVRLFDNDLRLKIQERAFSESRLHDVGGALTTKRFPNNGRVDDPETYRRFPSGSLINFLIHPGNYDIAKPLTLGLRTNLPDREEVQRSRPFVELPQETGLKRWLFDLGQIVRGVAPARG